MSTPNRQKIYFTCPRTSILARVRNAEVMPVVPLFHHTTPEESWRAWLLMHHGGGESVLDPAYFVIVAARAAGSVSSEWVPEFRLDWSEVHDPQAFGFVLSDERSKRSF